MPDQELMDLCRYRLEKASQCLATAKNTMVDGDYATSANRSYYAIFHGIGPFLHCTALISKNIRRLSPNVGNFISNQEFLTQSIPG